MRFICINTTGLIKSRLLQSNYYGNLDVVGHTKTSTQFHDILILINHNKACLKTLGVYSVVFSYWSFLMDSEQHYVPAVYICCTLGTVSAFSLVLHVSPQLISNDVALHLN